MQIPALVRTTFVVLVVRAWVCPHTELMRHLFWGLSTGGAGWALASKLDGSPYLRCLRCLCCDICSGHRCEILSLRGCLVLLVRASHIVRSGGRCYIFFAPSTHTHSHINDKRCKQEQELTGKITLRGTSAPPKSDHARTHRGLSSHLRAWAGRSSIRREYHLLHPPF